ncbi:lactonase family protein [Thermocatellispora tengchongensis]|uniref:lactonase family protein n=1 Tax=Thermocatellispora tengchongensis TaxID=1073253 RepID=UPI003636173E
MGEGADGTVSAFARHSDGTLAHLATRPSGGAQPCHLAVDPQGAWLAVANYGDGTLGAYRLDEHGAMVGKPRLFRHTGTGPDPERQECPHAHQVVFGPDGTLYVSDLGTDEIRRYSVGDEIAPHPAGHVRVSPGMGPRHMAFLAGRWYVSGELDGSVRAYDESWTEVAVGRAGASGAANLPSHLEVSPDGRHVYVANRGPDTITTLRADDLSHVAETPCGGAWPRHFATAWDRMYVACQHSDAVTVLPLHRGVPQAPEETLDLPTPSCVLFDPDF